ncbi:MAG: hypothetical protein L6Q47_16915 [Ignavibacteriaceae bacterium]|nr:hypothetical protein [Ignavibacteriaceae bacterium]
MKKIIYLVVLLSQFFLTQDLQVKISESSIQNLFNSLAQARYFSYGKADLSGVVTFYNIKATGMSLDIQPDNQFTITFESMKCFVTSPLEEFPWQIVSPFPITATFDREFGKYTAIVIRGGGVNGKL